MRKASTVATSEVRAYVEARGFGRVPPRLADIMDGLEDEREYIAALPDLEAEMLSEDANTKPLVRLLTDVERLALVQGLIDKQEQVEQCYEAELALRPEEVWQRKVRERYEPQMQQIDMDLEKMNRRYIFVAAEDAMSHERDG